METLAKELQKILTGTDDYLSHRTALYFLGFLPEPPDPGTVITKGRRRARQFAGRGLQFVTHPPQRPREVQEVWIGEVLLQISTIEQTLVDLVSDLHLGFRVEEVGPLFARLPYRVSRLVELAGATSDVVLKRVMFWLFWSGRGSWEDLPRQIPRTPVKLDPALDSLPFSWARPLYLRYPRMLRTLDLPAGPEPISGEVEEWGELLRYAPFRAFQDETDWFPIRGDPRQGSLRHLEQFWTTELTRLIASEPEPLLIQAFPDRGGKYPSGPLPRLFLVWVSANPRFPDDWRAEIGDWARAALSSTDPARLEAAIYWAHRAGFCAEAMARLAESGTILFQAGRGSVAYLLCDPASTHQSWPIGVRLLFSRVLARDEQFDKALSVIEAGRQGKAGASLTSNERGDLAYVAGIILRQARRFSEALRELEEARSCFTGIRDIRRQGMIAVALGNLHLSQGNLIEARRRYREALVLQKGLLSDSTQANLLTNLGMVESKSCRYQRAVLYLGRAARLQRSLGNSHGAAVALATLGKVLLDLGNIPRAFRTFRDTLDIQEQLPEIGRRSETMALLAWTCDLLGRPAAAKTWWERISAMEQSAIPKASQFLIRVVQALGQMLSGAWEKATGTLQESLEQARVLEIPPDEAGWLWLLLGIAQTRSGSPRAIDSLTASLRELAPYTGNVQAGIARVFGALHHPTHFPDVNPGEILLRLVDDQFYDPFWFTYAPALMDLAPRGASAFLDSQALRTPQGLRRILGRRVRVLQPLFSRGALLEKGEEGLTRLRNGQPEPMEPGDYLAWKKRMGKGDFRFDGLSGRLAFGTRKGFLRRGSNPHEVLSHLLLAFPEPVELKSLYRSVWGGEYDPECDDGALKITLLRLRKCLTALSPDLQLIWGKSQTRSRHLVLSIEGSWEAVL